MTTSTALVGPLPTVRFHDGTRQVYDVPRDTCDPRYSQCTQHRVACDCREAMLAEDRVEWRGMYEGARAAADEILAGHPTWVYVPNPDGDGWDTRPGCMCTGCQIARKAWLLDEWRFIAGLAELLATTQRRPS